MARLFPALTGPAPADASEGAEPPLPALPGTLEADSPTTLEGRGKADAILHTVDEMGAHRCCYAWPESMDAHHAQATVRYHVERGRAVWLENDRVAYCYLVEKVSQLGDRAVLSLGSTHVERRRRARRETDIQARIAWSDGAARGEIDAFLHERAEAPA